MASLTKILFAVIAISATAVASPIKDSLHGERAAQCGAPDIGVSIPPTVAPFNGIPKKKIDPVIYNVFPTDPERFETPFGGLHLETYEGQSQVEQLVVFKNIPPNAKHCQIVIETAPKANRVFLAKIRDDPTKRCGESHLINIHGLARGLPDGRITYSSIQGLYNPNERIGGFELAGWDNAEAQGPPPAKYDVLCVPSLSVKLGYRQTAQEKALYLHQDDKNGVFLRYDL